MSQVFGMATTLYDVDVTRQTRDDALQWRAEDINFRRESSEWRRQDELWRHADLLQRRLDNQRREIDEKNDQLRSISVVASLIAGFALTVLVVQFYQSAVPAWLVGLLTFSTACIVCLMTYSVSMSTLMLVAILKRFEGRGGDASEQLFDSQSIHENELSRFELFWDNQCASDWFRVLHSFLFGLNLFLINLLLVGWVRFWPMTFPALTVTIVCLATLIFLSLTVNMKWLSYLFAPRKPSEHDSGIQGRSWFT
jgi:hypothetical protein